MCLTQLLHIYDLFLTKTHTYENNKIPIDKEYKY